jgi:hypothetical protein
MTAPFVRFASSGRRIAITIIASSRQVSVTFEEVVVVFMFLHTQYSGRCGA